MHPYICMTCLSECPGGMMCPVCDAPAHRYLFLDIDGVLNSITWFRAREKMPEYHEARKQIGLFYEAWDETWSVLRKVWQLDPIACQVLQDLVTTTKTRVVVSSCWRSGRKDELQQALGEHGFTHPLYHRTPTNIDGKTEVDQYKRSETLRGLEIEHWILTYVPHDQFDNLRIAILDDSYDMGRLAPWHVPTDMASGLDPSHTRLVQEALERPLLPLLSDPNPLWTPEARGVLYDRG